MARNDNTTLTPSKNPRFKHGFADSPTQVSWSHMKARCYDTKHPHYDRYGGRGIGVCFAWRTDFRNFLADAGARPSLDYSIDRPDNNGGYWCGHCEECIVNRWPKNWRWATRREQHNNKSSCHYLTVDGVTHTAIEWSRIKGIKQSTLSQRLVHGWSDYDAVMTPVRVHRRASIE